MKIPHRRRPVRSFAGPAFLLALASAPPATAQSVAEFVPEAARGASFPLSIRSIMAGPELVGQEPMGIRWTDDGSSIHFRWLPGGNAWDAEREAYRVRADGTGLERVSDEEVRDMAVRLADGDVSPDGRYKVVSVRGDLFRVDRRSGQVDRLTHTREGESGARFTPDGAILYRAGENLFRLQDGVIVQVTDIRSGNAPRDEEEAQGLRRFLEEQQVELFEHIRRQQAREEEEEAREEAVRESAPEPLYIPQGERLGQLEPSPDGSHVLVSAFSQARDARQTMVPDWVTESGYTEPLNVRTKVGDEQGSSRLGLLVSATGETTWLDAAPEGAAEDSEWSLNAVGWNDAGTHALLYARSDDDTEWVLSTLEAATGEVTVVARERNEAWVGGPCGFGCRGWLPESSTVWYVSEESGYSHVYTVNADGTGTRQLTSGEWEVLDVELLAPEQADRHDAAFFITTNEGSPFNQHVGFMTRDGARTYLTEGDGRFAGTLSPDGRRIALVHDVANRPPELFVAEARRAMRMTRVTDSPTEEWKSFGWIRPEIIRFQARDGVAVPARIYRPEDVGGTPNGAAVVFVHGAGYLHNVHNYWSSYSREYMFHHLLAAQGYTVLDIDYRGSAGYGAEWRTGIYRFMGGKDLTDQEDGARWLVANEGIDAGRIGIYGGSYGGFITLMALTTGDQLFKSGAALRSVTDWAHYNDGYTSNILNDPQEDREAYVRSSPIYHAENLRDDQHLLILHGMVDTNVHFSDVVRYAQRLIELGKENWEFAVYPVENHGFVEPSSWTDEYRRIFELFERTLSRPDCTANGGLCAVPGR
ncbi:MAG TPA: prolyl oligopeptidase family serine peptidase [Longimicrobiales bacterium]|nr:prolyl oligopeptidase family serine peptidase [Longimicrobiales bacterium]